MIDALLCLALAAAAASPEERAVDFLAAEVPRWKTENGCYSCHNNGDAARALYRARRFASAADTTAWLTRPNEWQSDQGDPRFRNKPLIQIQFASALEAALQFGATNNRQALADAARALLPLQDADGSWPVETDANPGSPVTYGRALATYTSRRILTSAHPTEFRASIKRATDWLRKQAPNSTPDASALVLALKNIPAIQFLKRAQASDGGFGPYPKTPPEAFDTAIAILALKSAGRHETEIQKARAWLLATQEADGSWPETTRPRGAQSYAQRMSTTAWAAIALMQSR